MKSEARMTVIFRIIRPSNSWSVQVFDPPSETEQEAIGGFGPLNNFMYSSKAPLLRRNLTLEKTDNTWIL
jgi:hypothetical protein